MDDSPPVVPSPDLRHLHRHPQLVLTTPDSAPQDDDLHALLDDLYAAGARRVQLTNCYHYPAAGGGLDRPVTAADWAGLPARLAAAPLELFCYTLHITLPPIAQRCVAHSRGRETILLRTAQGRPDYLDLSADGDLLIAGWE
jgi:hypothetical protein